MSSALITIVAMAASAAITAGALVLAGVGDDPRDERINQTAAALAAGIVRESPSVCSSWTGFVDVRTWRILVPHGLRFTDFSDLSEAERTKFSDRFADELGEECEVLSR